MIDIEQELFKRLSTAVKETYSNAVVYGEYIAAPASFPCIMIQEISSTTYSNSQTTESLENHALIGVQVDIFANGDTKKQLAKAIAKIVDDTMLGLKFSRVMLEKLSNEESTNIYHIIGRYDAIVGSDYRIYTI